MITIFLILVSFIIIYLIYPFWLMMQSEQQAGDVKDAEEICNVSLIYLSYNGVDFLERKINFLLKELSVFQKYELIIIDDNSTDKSHEILNKFKGDKNISIILKSEPKGIPHSMNLGVRKAKYDHLVFCDQRQCLSDNVLKQLVDPLKNKKVGAVSACISQLDKKNCFSLIRSHENYIKSQESKTGNLMGVYGPLYAVKKSCYAEIPDHIILDDLYLTLKILRFNQVWLIKECKIIEDDAGLLYNYQRTKRYLQGFLQLITEKDLISQLKKKQIIMLFWHKYFRLFIPLFLFLSYISFGIMGIKNPEITIVFSIMTILLIISILPVTIKIGGRLKNFIRINFLYFLAFSEIFFIGFCYKKLISNASK